LSEEILQDELAELIQLIIDQLSACDLMYPAASKQLLVLLDHMDTLSKIKIAYMLDCVVEEINALPGMPEKRALLIKETRLVSDVERSLVNHPTFRQSSAVLRGPIPIRMMLKEREVIVVNPTVLREQDSYEKLIVIGPSRWYPDYVFSAPRSSNILIMKYSWIKDGWQQKTVFAEPLKQKTNKEIIVFDVTEDDSAISPEDLLPMSLDFQLIARKATDELRNGSELDYVDAKAFLLEDEWAVFLDGDEAASAIVIDLESDYLRPIKRIKTNDIKAGMFILLRTGGGGDYIVPVADQIMQDKATTARRIQKEWKTRLRERVRVLSYEQVIVQLSALGSIRANRTNIHNWMSERSIKPEFFSDFKAIMQLIGIEKDAEFYWEMMRLIDQAHLKAGMQIRRMLLEKVRASDLDTLRRTGIMEFSLPGEELVSITAFQVLDISSEVIPVAPWRIGDPFKPDE